MSYWLCRLSQELRAVAEVVAEAGSDVGADGAAPVQNIGDAAGRHADVDRKPIGAQHTRAQLAFRQTARMHGGGAWFHPLW